MRATASSTAAERATTSRIFRLRWGSIEGFRIIARAAGQAGGGGLGESRRDGGEACDADHRSEQRNRRRDRARRRRLPPAGAERAPPGGGRGARRGAWRRGERP